MDESLRSRITVAPDVRGGKPCIRGTRVTPDEILEYLAGGMTEAEVLNDFPYLVSEDLAAAQAYLAERDVRPS